MRIRGGYAALYSSAIVFALTSLTVKLASRHYSGLFISASRFAIGTLLCVAVLALGYRSLKPAHPLFVALRGAFGAFSMAMSYGAIALTGPGRAAPRSSATPIPSSSRSSAPSSSASDSVRECSPPRPSARSAPSS
jgi:drug/metabolite transporter (DMT)-like permease